MIDLHREKGILLSRVECGKKDNIFYFQFLKKSKRGIAQPG